MIDGFWAPLVSALLVLVASGLGLLAGSYIWLFASLGPTAYLLVADRDEPSSRICNVIVGHLIAALADYASAYIFGIAHQPSVFSLGYLTPSRWQGKERMTRMGIDVRYAADVATQHGPLWGKG